MQFLNESNRQLVRERFDKELDGDVTVTLFTQPDLKGLVVPGRDCESCAPTEQLLKEVSELSSKVTLRTINYRENTEESESFSIERIPTIVISRDSETNVRYLGIPSGTEFPVLLEAIVNVSSRAPKLSDDTVTFLERLDSDVSIKVFVTPN